jgi:hypothetical protein
MEDLPWEGGVPPGAPPPPPVAMPLAASPGPKAMAIWDKVPEGLRNNHARIEMSSYLALLRGQVENPEALALVVMADDLIGTQVLLDLTHEFGDSNSPNYFSALHGELCGRLGTGR